LPTLAPEPNVAAGQVATSAPTQPLLAIDITPCDADLLLAIESVEILGQSGVPKVSARVRAPNLRVHTGSVRLTPVEILGETQARPLDNGRRAELVVTVDADVVAQMGTIAAPSLQNGNYLLDWTPLAPDGRSLGSCQQIITVSNQ
jgi:hypothetical protein